MRGRVGARYLAGVAPTGGIWATSMRYGGSHFCVKIQGGLCEPREGPSGDLRVSVHPEGGRGALLGLLGVTHGHIRLPGQPTEH